MDKQETELTENSKSLQVYISSSYCDIVQTHNYLKTYKSSNPVSQIMVSNAPQPEETQNDDYHIEMK